ncbi:MarR family winged helix-turn-helix transcriptional regulator [Pseudoflavonifractor phocaeensis]|uniref:MarR family winged helix-turn-helix transcriptional regulator n=1 Tax=Pseudoflavonifractor phocaeensis TaxID=1870988 RepID=UPI001958094F|nr:MarR family transcriptional regulator [Pseudoflavonifractor phocaeensis]MBM6924731.1 MarR family transcriptional regulator [Pseudoflavonifractor phocaeensis]
MDTSFHYLLAASAALFQRKVMAGLSDSGLTAGQPKVLDYLGLHDGSMQKDIAAGCQIDPATLTGLLNRMEEKGLIQRRVQPEDRRSFHVYLTEQGRDRQRLVRRTLEQMGDEVLAGFSREERMRLEDGLYRLCQAMTNMEVLQ